MYDNLITVKVLMNRVLLKPPLINTSYECYSIMDKDFITELRLPRITILRKPIINFVKKMQRNLKWKS